jgi:hypothetical protein
MKPFLVFAVLGPLILTVLGLVFNAVMGWRANLGGAELFGQLLAVCFGLGLPPLVAAWAVYRRPIWTSFQTRLKAAAITGLVVGIVYPFVGAMIGGGRIPAADYSLFPLFGLVIGAVAALCAYLANRLEPGEV